MWRHIVFFGVALISTGVVFAQTKKHFSVENTGEFKKIVLNYTSTSGTCYISPSTKPEAFSIHGNSDIDNFVYDFDDKVDNKVLSIAVKIEDKATEGLSQSIPRMFKKEKGSVDPKIWKLYLNEDKPYHLNLNFGLGEAFVDLSGLSVEKIKINTGSANVNVGYLSEISNQVDMDTFAVKVDLGSLNMRRIAQARAKVILAEVGFGNAFIDLSEAPRGSSYVQASVGAGNLEILVPKMSTGIKVAVNQSLLCQVKLPREFSEVEDDVYVNAAYVEGGEDQLVFQIDVSLGTILIKEKK